MKDNMKMILLGAAVVVIIALGVFAYKKANPSIQSDYDPAHAGPPAYMKGGGADAYRASQQGQGTSSGAPSSGSATGGRGQYDMAPKGAPTGRGSSYGSGTYSNGGGR